MADLARRLVALEKAARPLVEADLSPATALILPVSESEQNRKGSITCNRDCTCWRKRESNSLWSIYRSTWIRST